MTDERSLRNFIRDLAGADAVDPFQQALGMDDDEMGTPVAIVGEALSYYLGSNPHPTESGNP